MENVLIKKWTFWLRLLLTSIFSIYYVVFSAVILLISDIITIPWGLVVLLIELVCRKPINVTHLLLPAYIIAYIKVNILKLDGEYIIELFNWTKTPYDACRNNAEEAFEQLYKDYDEINNERDLGD